MKEEDVTEEEIEDLLNAEGVGPRGDALRRAMRELRTRRVFDEICRTERLSARRAFVVQAAREICAASFGGYWAHSGTSDEIGEPSAATAVWKANELADALGFEPEKKEETP